MTIAAGMAAGLVFDLYRLARRGLRPRGSGAWVLDLLFWLVVTPVVFALLLVGNWGELRFYVLVGLVAGAVLYFGLMSELCLRFVGGLLWMAGQTLLVVGHGVVRCLMVPAALLHWLVGTAAGRWAAGRRAWGGRPGRWGRPVWLGPPWRPFGRRI